MTDNLKLTEQSIVALLDLILSETKADRVMALENYEALSAQFSPSAEDMSISGLMAINDLSDSLSKFLKQAQGSIEQQIKIAKIIADLVSKAHEEEGDGSFEPGAYNETQAMVVQLVQDQNNEASETDEAIRENEA